MSKVEALKEYRCRRDKGLPPCRDFGKCMYCDFFGLRETAREKQKEEYDTVFERLLGLEETQ